MNRASDSQKSQEDRPSRLSINDVAREAGVSIATVSRVLNNRAGDIKISEKTRARVLEVVERIGYRRNRFAVALRTDRTGVIGAITSNLSGTFMSRLAQHVQDAAHKREVEVLFAAMRMDKDDIGKQMEVLRSQLFDGVLLLGNMPGYQDLIRSGNGAEKPSVSISAHTEAQVPVVNVDWHSVVTKALSHLVVLGHTRIAFLGSDLWPNHRDLLEHYRRFLTRHHLAAPREYAVMLPGFPYAPAASDFTEQSHSFVTRHTASLLDLGPPPTAIFCANDGFAAAVIKGLQRSGHRVPENMSVIGYGEETHAAIVNPELTTVRPPYEEMTEKAIDLLIEIIKKPTDEDLRRRRILLEPSLLERESCGPPRP